MAAYNGERYISSAIDSILGQTLADFEFIIVDDGSSDATPNILGGIRDPRLWVIQNEVNRGQAAALNRGLEAAKGAYIARMDADDEALPERLERQVAFMENHADIGILGTAYRIVNSGGQPGKVVAWPSDDLAIRWMSLLAPPFLHSSVMMRAETLRTHGLRYDESYRTAQDFELWGRILSVSRGANLGDVLVRYRVHDESINRSQRIRQLSNHDKIAQDALRTVFGAPAPAPEDVTGLRRMFIGGDASEPVQTGQERLRLARLYLDLLQRFAGLHAGQCSLGRLLRDEALRVAYKVFAHPPFMGGWLTLGARLIRMQPGILWRLVARILKGRRGGVGA